MVKRTEIDNCFYIFTKFLNKTNGQTCLTEIEECLYLGTGEYPKNVIVLYSIYCCRGHVGRNSLIFDGMLEGMLVGTV
jgi:hypothetical protein